MMSQVHAIFIMTFIVLCLGACVKTHDSATSRLNPGVCRSECLSILQACQAICKNNRPACERLSDVSVTRHYQQYVHQQTVQGGIIARELNAYRDPLQCRKPTCDCVADYHQCKRICT